MKKAKMLKANISPEFEDYWLLTPILGQAPDDQLEVTLVFKLRRPMILFCRVNSLAHPPKTITIDPPSSYFNWRDAAPSTLKLTLPEYGLYELTWYILENTYSYRQLPIGHQWLPVRQKIDRVFAFSCDMPEADARPSLWDKMTSEVVACPTACLHLGDQIYGDAVYEKHAHRASPNPADVYADYGYLYQKVWAPRRVFLAQAWNYFLADDHEITNDVRLYDNLTEPQRVVADSAWQAYLDYQMAAVPKREPFYSDFSYATWIGSTRLLMIERTTKPININELVLAIEELEQDYETLIIGLACAPVVKPKGFGTSLLSDGRYLPKVPAMQLYDCLLSLADQGKRVILLGGDCHYGSHRQILRGSAQIDVLTCSPISNQPDISRLTAVLATKNRTLQVEGYQPVHELVISCHARKNYAEIDLNKDMIDVHYGASQPRSWAKYVKHILTLVPR